MVNCFMKYGFSLDYTDDEAYRNLNARGIFYSDKLPQVVKKIKAMWVQGLVSHDDNTRARCYVDKNGNFAVLRKETPEPRRLRMTLGSQNMQNLEAIAKALNLPFNQKHVRTDGGC